MTASGPAQSPGRRLKVAERSAGVLAVCFEAMGGPCEVLLHGIESTAAVQLAAVAAEEAWRVERKYSRYREDSIVAWIHRNRGSEVRVDEETAELLEFARQCHAMSEGRFDITSGVLRRAWKFDGSDRVPSPAEIEQLMPLVGFGKIRWERPMLLLPAQMELDFGGIGKEYAVDLAYNLLAARCVEPFLINFGGDLRANRPPPYGVWQIGVERPDVSGDAVLMLDLQSGALATSGDTHRFLLKDGIRYSHILDARTGWSVVGAPRSITVAASSCTEAGLLSTLAMLCGVEARAFLERESARYWIVE